MSDRRELVLDAAITLLGEQGVRAVTHRAVDAEAGLAAGSTSNLFRTRDALFDGIVERFAARERANWEDLAARRPPTTRTELAQVMAAFALEATGRYRTLTLARYGLLVEAGLHPSLRPQLTATGAQVSAWATAWMRLIGSADPDRDTHLVLNYWTGLVLHQLAIPDPAFDPGPKLVALLDGIVPAVAIPTG